MRVKRNIIFINNTFSAIRKKRFFFFTWIFLLLEGWFAATSRFCDFLKLTFFFLPHTPQVRIYFYMWCKGWTPIHQGRDEFFTILFLRKALWLGCIHHWRTYYQRNICKSCAHKRAITNQLVCHFCGAILAMHFCHWPQKREQRTQLGDN